MEVERIQSRTNLNGGELERIPRDNGRMTKIQSRTNLNGGELERIGIKNNRKSKTIKTESV